MGSRLSGNGLGRDVYDATSTEELHINTDKLWRYIEEYKNQTKLLTQTLASFATFLTTLLALMTSTYDKEKAFLSISAELWRVIFLLVIISTAVYGIYGFVKLLLKKFQGKYQNTDQLIAKIKAAAIKRK